MGKMIKKFFNDFEVINKYYNYLVTQTKNKEFVGITNEWLIDNFYLLVEHKTNIVHDKKEIIKREKLIENIYFPLKNIAMSHNYNIDFSILVSELNKYQKENKKYFSYKEIVSIKDTLLFIYTDRLKNLCEEEQKNLLETEKIVHIIKEKDGKDVELSNFIKHDFNLNQNKYYIFALNNELSSLGAKSNKLFKELNELLENRQISLKEIINEEYQRKIDNNILISNIFNDLKEFFDFSNEELFKKVSKTEKMLLSDEVYEKMTVESKNLYRTYLLKNCKKYGVTAIELGVQSAVDEVLKISNRGHSFEDVVKASELIQSYGIELGLQMMTGLPGDTYERSIETARKIAGRKPKNVRIYPTLVMEGTHLFEMYKKGTYIPQKLEYAVNLAADAAEIFLENNIEILRIALQTTDGVNEDTVIGPYHPAFAELVYSEIEKRKIEKELLENNIRNCEYTVESADGNVSKIIGHKKSNKIYFKEKYGVDLIVK